MNRPGHLDPTFVDTTNRSPSASKTTSWDPATDSRNSPKPSVVRSLRTASFTINRSRLVPEKLQWFSNRISSGPCFARHVFVGMFVFWVSLQTDRVEKMTVGRSIAAWRLGGLAACRRLPRTTCSPEHIVRAPRQRISGENPAWGLLRVAHRGWRVAHWNTRDPPPCIHSVPHHTTWWRPCPRPHARYRPMLGS